MAKTEAGKRHLGRFRSQAPKIKKNPAGSGFQTEPQTHPFYAATEVLWIFGGCGVRNQCLK